MVEKELAQARPFLEVICDLPAAIDSGQALKRTVVAKPDGGRQPNPLVSGTEQFADGWLVEWHRNRHPWPQRDVATYLIADAVVSGHGQVWLNGSLITSEEVMPKYVSDFLDLSNGGNDRLHRFRSLPIRFIDGPCLVAVGHGAKVYGHFLIEMLFRLLAANRCFTSDHVKPRVLLAFDSPTWLLHILKDYFGLDSSNIEFLRRDEERVQLRHAIVPTLLARDERFLPEAELLIEDLLRKLDIPGPQSNRKRTFISRKSFQTIAAPLRACQNEDQLIEIAVQQHKFTPVSVENLSWQEQIALFRDSNIILGLAGSGLHNALFSKENTRVASIGFMNLVQSQIGAFRGQHNAYLSKNIKLAGNFTVDEDRFRVFLRDLCDSS